MSVLKKTAICWRCNTKLDLDDDAVAEAAHRRELFEKVALVMLTKVGAEEDADLFTNITKFVTETILLSSQKFAEAKS